MQARKETRQEGAPASPPLSALGMFLMVSAGVAVIAQETERLRANGRETPYTTAAIRIMLPEPTSANPVLRGGSTGTLRFLMRDLGPAAPAPRPAVPQPIVPEIVAPDGAELAASAVDLPILTLGPKLLTPEPTYGEPELAAELAREPGTATAGFSATMREISASFSAASGKPHTGAARAGRLAEIADGAFQPSPGQSLATSRADGPDPARTSQRTQMILTEAMTPRKRRVASVSLQVSALVNEAGAGRVSLLINDSENISARLADLLAILKPAIKPELYERLAGSQAAQTYMTFNELREAGSKVRFDAKDRLHITTP